MNQLLNESLTEIAGDICYYNVHQKKALSAFTKQMRQLKKLAAQKKQHIVFLCIGSDRATGDCFGPLIGTNLLTEFSKSHSPSAMPSVFGTLAEPVHAMNLEKTVYNIKKLFYSPFIIAIDASLGIRQHVGYITLGNVPLLPGIGVQKKLPEIGDASITGIVNISGKNCHSTLQTTHLSTVVELSDFTTEGILKVFL
ncbi:MAG: spore protease YyaC [Butyribacter sp.]|nr:spore protease YyaC [bacterium]MDY3853747.1 spore protease YyaC [Butyribacter sp.]